MSECQLSMKLSMNVVEPPLEWESLARLLNIVPVGVAVHDDFGRITWTNHELERQLGLDRDSIKGNTLDALPLVASEHQTGDGLLFHLPDSSEHDTQWVSIINATVEQDGQPVEVSFFIDVTGEEHAKMQVDRLHQALRGQASTDKATGLPTRKVVLTQLEDQVSRSRRYHNLLSVMLIRLTCSGGNTEKPGLPVLSGTSNLLRAETRWPDIIGQWDEQTFLLVLPETSADSAGSLAKKIRQQFVSQVEGFPPEAAHCDITMGIAEWCKGDNAGDLVHKAIDDLTEKPGS